MKSVLGFKFYIGAYSLSVVHKFIFLCSTETLKKAVSAYTKANKPTKSPSLSLSHPYFVYSTLYYIPQVMKINQCINYKTTKNVQTRSFHCSSNAFLQFEITFESFGFSKTLLNIQQKKCMYRWFYRMD